MIEVARALADAYDAMAGAEAEAGTLSYVPMGVA